MAVGKPIYIIKPYEACHAGRGFVPYFYKEELKEKGIEQWQVVIQKPKHC